MISTDVGSISAADTQRNLSCHYSTPVVGRKPTAKYCLCKFFPKIGKRLERRAIQSTITLGMSIWVIEMWLLKRQLRLEQIFTWFIQLCRSLFGGTLLYFKTEQCLLVQQWFLKIPGLKKRWRDSQLHSYFLRKNSSFYYTHVATRYPGPTTAL